MADRENAAAKVPRSFIDRFSAVADQVTRLLKLDELLRVTKGARKRLIDEEHRPEQQLDADEREFRR